MSELSEFNDYYEKQILKAIEKRDYKLFSKLLNKIASPNIRCTFLTLWKTTKTTNLLEKTISELDQFFYSQSQKQLEQQKKASQGLNFSSKDHFKCIEVRQLGHKLTLLKGAEFLSASPPTIYPLASSDPSVQPPPKNKKLKPRPLNAHQAKKQSSKVFHFTHFVLKMQHRQFLFSTNCFFKKASFFHHQSQTELIFKNTTHFSHLLKQGNYSLELDKNLYQLVLK